MLTHSEVLGDQSALRVQLQRDGGAHRELLRLNWARPLGDIAFDWAAILSATAAVIWILAAVGSAIGLGFMRGAIALSLITVAILFVLKSATGQMLGRLMDAVEPALVDEVEAELIDDEPAQQPAAPEIGSRFD